MPCAVRRLSRRRTTSSMTWRSVRAGVTPRRDNWPDTALRRPHADAGRSGPGPDSRPGHALATSPAGGRASRPSPATARGNSHVSAGPAYRASRDRPAAADRRAPSSRPSSSSRRRRHEDTRHLGMWRQVKPTAGASVRLQPSGQWSDSGAQAARSRVVVPQDHDKEGPKTMSTKTRTDLTAHVRSRVDSLPRACWCGQELEHTGSRFCPRCGSASRPGTPVVLSLPAV